MKSKNEREVALFGHLFIEGYIFSPEAPSRPSLSPSLLELNNLSMLLELGKQILGIFNLYNPRLALLVRNVSAMKTEVFVCFVCYYVPSTWDGARCSVVILLDELMNSKRMSIVVHNVP